MKSYARAVVASAFLHSLHAAGQSSSDNDPLYSSSLVGTGTASTGGTGLWPGNYTVTDSGSQPPYPVTTSSTDVVSETPSEPPQDTAQPTTPYPSGQDNSTVPAGTFPVPFSSSSSTIIVASSTLITSTRVAGNTTSNLPGTGADSSSSSMVIETTPEQPSFTVPSNGTEGQPSGTGSSTSSSASLSGSVPSEESSSASSSNVPSGVPSNSQNGTTASTEASTSASTNGEVSSTPASNSTVASSGGVPVEGPTIIYATITTSGSAGVITTTKPVISGGAISSPIPVPGSDTVYGTLDPTGTEASSRAEDIKTSLDNIVPILSSYTENPDPPGATSAIEAIESVQPGLEDLFSDLDPQNVESEDCGGGNPITALFNAVKCTVNELEDTISNIETEIDSDFTDMSITGGITGISGTLGGALSGSNSGGDNQDGDNDDDDDDDDDDQSSSQSASSTSASSSSSSCSASAATTEICDTVCVTPTPASGSTFPASASLTTQSCTTTCDTSTLTACDATASATPESTTSVLTISADACPLTSSVEGPWTTAWWDYGISCAGSGCGDIGAMPPGPSYASFPWDTVSASTTVSSDSVSETGSISSTGGSGSGSGNSTSLSTAGSASASSMSSDDSPSSTTPTSGSDSLSTITSAPTESVTPGCVLIYSYSGNVGQQEYTKCLCDGTTKSLSTSIDGDTSVLECPTTSGDFTAVSTKVNTPPPTTSSAAPETTSSAPPPEETFPPAAPVDPGVQQCGAVGNYDPNAQGGGPIEAGDGVTVNAAEIMVAHFCDLGATLSWDNNFISQPYADESGAVFWLQAEVVSDECDFELELGGDDENYGKCYDPMMGNINGCNTDTTDAKIGGQYAEGCVIWTALSVSNWDGPDPFEAPASTQPGEGDGGDDGGEVDEDSPEYNDCIDDMGASSCSADDPQCLVDECKANEQCSASGIDCESYGDI